MARALVGAEEAQHSDKATSLPQARVEALGLRDAARLGGEREAREGAAGERSSAITMKPFTKKWTLVLDDAFNKAMLTAASFSLEEWRNQIVAVNEPFKGTSNVSISSISPKR